MFRYWFALFWCVLLIILILLDQYTVYLLLFYIQFGPFASFHFFWGINSQWHADVIQPDATLFAVGQIPHPNLEYVCLNLSQNGHASSRITFWLAMEARKRWVYSFDWFRCVGWRRRCQLEQRGAGWRMRAGPVPAVPLDGGKVDQSHSDQIVLIRWSLSFSGGAPARSSAALMGT